MPPFRLTTQYPRMFWRLFASHLSLAVAAVGLVGLVILQRAERVFYDLAPVVAVAVAVIAAVAAVPAYLLARKLSRPMAELIDGANRLAAKDYGHTVRVSGGRDHAALAAAFNGLSAQLAETFHQLDHDHDQLRAILSGMVEGVVATNADGRVLFANDRAGKLLGFEPAAAVGRPLAEVVGRDAFLEVVRRGLSSTEPVREELDGKAAGSLSLTVYVSRFPGNGRPGAVAVVNDTSDLRRLERLRQDFVANVSHELKTPLAIIKSNVEALTDGAVADPTLGPAFLAQVAQEADRLEELILDLLSLARLDSGELGLDPGPVRLDKAIADCLERHHTRAEAKTLTLVEKPPRDGPLVVAAWADADALRQVLYNLTDNAIKYTPNGGRITARWGATENGVWFEVEDTGVGIPDRDVPRVFERFYRVDKARSREMGGTGLGLAIVKNLVVAMKGQVRVTSAVGKGTTFRVTLPRAAG